MSVVAPNLDAIIVLKMFRSSWSTSAKSSISTWSTSVRPHMPSTLFHFLKLYLHPIQNNVRYRYALFVTKLYQSSENEFGTLLLKAIRLRAFLYNKTSFLVAVFCNRASIIMVLCYLYKIQTFIGLLKPACPNRVYPR